MQQEARSNQPSFPTPPPDCIAIPAEVAAYTGLKPPDKLAYGALLAWVDYRPGLISFTRMDLSQACGAASEGAAQFWVKHLAEAGLIEIRRKGGGGWEVEVKHWSVLRQARSIGQADPQRKLIADVDDPPEEGQSAAPQDFAQNPTKSFAQDPMKSFAQNSAAADVLRFPVEAQTPTVARVDRVSPRPRGEPAAQSFAQNPTARGLLNLNHDLNNNININIDRDEGFAVAPLGFARGDVRANIRRIFDGLVGGQGVYPHLLQLPAYCLVVGPFTHERIDEICAACRGKRAGGDRGRYFVASLKHYIAEFRRGDFAADLGPFDPQARDAEGHWANLPRKREIAKAIQKGRKEEAS